MLWGVAHTDSFFFFNVHAQAEGFSEAKMRTTDLLTR